MLSIASELPALRVSKGASKLNKTELADYAVPQSLHETPQSGYGMNAITSTKHSLAKN